MLVTRFLAPLAALALATTGCSHAMIATGGILTVAGVHELSNDEPTCDEGPTCIITQPIAEGGYVVDQAGGALLTIVGVGLMVGGLVMMHYEHERDAAQPALPTTPAFAVAPSAPVGAPTPSSADELAVRASREAARRDCSAVIATMTQLASIDPTTSRAVIDGDAQVTECLLRPMSASR